MNREMNLFVSRVSLYLSCGSKKNKSGIQGVWYSGGMVFRGYGIQGYDIQGVWFIFVV